MLVLQQDLNAKQYVTYSFEHYENERSYQNQSDDFLRLARSTMCFRI